MNKEVKKLPPSHFYARQNRACRPHHMAGSHAVSCRTEKHKYIRRTYTEEHELFDIEKDPSETVNLRGRPEYGKVEHEMEKRLLDFMLQTADVLPYEHDSRKI